MYVCMYVCRCANNPLQANCLRQSPPHYIYYYTSYFSAFSDAKVQKKFKQGVQILIKVYKIQQSGVRKATFLTPDFSNRQMKTEKCFPHHPFTTTSGEPAQKSESSRKLFLIRPLTPATPSRPLTFYIYALSGEQVVGGAIFCIFCQTGQNECRYLRALGQVLDCVSPK